MTEQEMKEKREAAAEIGKILSKLSEEERRTLLNIMIGYKLGVETSKTVSPHDPKYA